MQLLRKLLLTLGAIFLVGLVFGAGGFFALNKVGTRLDAESALYVERIIAIISAQRSESSFINEGTLEFRQAVKPGDLDNILNALRQLGELTAYEGAQGDASMHYQSGNGVVISASYVAQARYENGMAAFQISLRKVDGSWRIHSFHFDPKPVSKSAVRERI